MAEQIVWINHQHNVEYNMKYLCLVYVEEKVLNAFPSHERLAISDEAMAYCDTLQKADCSPPPHSIRLKQRPQCGSGRARR